MATLTRNTDKDYPCVQCGSSNASIIREGPDPRLKCIDCNMLYNASNSLSLKEVGGIPTEAPKLQDPKPSTTEVFKESPAKSEPTKSAPQTSGTKIPRTPTYVFVSKDRTQSEFATKKTVREITLRWEYEGRKFDVFELSPKAVTTKVDIA